MNPVRVRFAPSPTGELHIGNLRTAVFNWLYARGRDGVFILRIEDTDPARSTPDFERSIIEDLCWLGLHWDEGPEINGPCAPYRQSERKGIYRIYADQLLAENKAYLCFCTAEELEEKKRLFLKKGLQPRYDGHCRDLAEPERNRLAGEGRRPAIRFKIAKRRVEFDDLVRGPVAFDAEQIGDFIIIRSDGMAAYNFCATVDDALMRIDCVIRGEDHLSNTPRQILILDAFGFKIPAYAHLSIIVDKNKAKLKKRENSPALRDLRALGFLPEAIVNYLALLGWTPADAKEIMTPLEAAGKFSLDRCARGPATYDLAKLRWLNAQHLRQLDTGRLTDLCLPLARECGFDAAGWNREKLEILFACARENMETLADLKTYLPLFFAAVPPLEKNAAEYLRGAGGAKVVQAFRREVENTPELTEETFARIVKNLKTSLGVSGKNLFMPIRAALTGRADGPELAKIFSLLSRETLLRRIDALAANRH